MQPTFRILTEDDTIDYQALRLYSYQEAPYAFSESYEEEEEKDIEVFAQELETIGNPPESFILGGFVGGRLISFVKFRRDLRSKGRHKAMIHAMYTIPDYRGNGIGKQIILEIIMRAMQMSGLEQIHLWVLHSEKHVSASDFYQELGFVSQGIVKNDLKIGEDYMDAEYMILYFPFLRLLKY